MAGSMLNLLEGSSFGISNHSIFWEVATRWLVWGSSRATEGWTCHLNSPRSKDRIPQIHSNNTWVHDHVLMAYFSGILPMFWTPISYSCFCLYLPIIYHGFFSKNPPDLPGFKKPQRVFSPRQTTLEFWRTRVQLLDLLIASEYWCHSGPVAGVERSGWLFFFGCREPWKHSPNWIMIYIYMVN